MSVSTDYLNSMVALAKAAHDQRVAKIQAEQGRKVSGTFTKDAAGKVTGYTPGTTGEYDVAYQRNKEGLEAGLESRGILRSGQAGTARTRQLSDYQQSVIDLYNATQADINQAGADYALEEAKLRAQYGTTPEPATPTNVPAPSGPKATDTTPSTSSAPAAERTPEAAAAFTALGQPENKQAATGKVTAAPAQSYSQAVGNVLFGNQVPWNQIGTSAFTQPAPPAPPKPPAPPAPPKPKSPPAPPKPPAPPAPPKPKAPAPVKKPITTKVR